MKNILIGIFASSILYACSTDTINSNEVVLELPKTPFSYSTNDELATLGRVLFYDKQLSINNSVSCASCHKQSIAFADNEKFSRGFDNNLTTRNSMPIQNLGGSFVFDEFSQLGTSGLFWDGRGVMHENGVLQPILNHIEMGIPDIPYLTKKLSEINYYHELFEDAFQDNKITSERIGEALTAFTHSITSNNTKFDESRFNRVELNGNELLGQDLFMNKYDCNSCHQVQDPQGYLFAGTFANIGLEIKYQDAGLEKTTGNSVDNGKFKIPSLRNVALTAPYMHDGRFETLNEVINHYKSTVIDHPNLDSRLKNEGGSVKKPSISEIEVNAIIAFLETMTDHKMINDPRFSNPFKIN